MTLRISPGIVLSAVFVALWATASCSRVVQLRELVILNGVLQVVWFVFVACVPYWRTGRVSYVDIAWPFGVALIGGLVLLRGDGAWLRRATVGGVYLAIGLRMGVGALVMAWRTGVIFRTEFPRYAYRRLKMRQSGVRHERAHLLVEIMAQGLANASVLAMPGFLLATNPSPSIHGLEIVGLCLWGAGFTFESVADGQKLRFGARSAGGVCDVGLWRLCRHPNYFGEWLVWSAIVVAAVPSWLALRDQESTGVWLCLGLAAVGASGAMYVTLVYLTGAVPAEYFSVRKRAAYRAYQARTNMFFPGRPRKARSSR